MLLDDTDLREDNGKVLFNINVTKEHSCNMDMMQLVHVEVHIATLY